MKLSLAPFRSRPSCLSFAFAALGALIVAASVASAQQGSAGGDDGLPLEPAGKLEFTTNEGTWLSLDVFPDGQSLVFDLLGDLYTLPIGGGTATRITEGMVSTASRVCRRTASGSPSSATATAATTCGSPAPMARTHASCRRSAERQ